MSVYCTLPRGGGVGVEGSGSFYHSSIHSSFPSSSSSSSSNSSSSTITSDTSMLTQGETIGSNYHHSVNPRYQHQSIKTMFNNPYSNSQQQQQQQQQQAIFNETSNSTNSLAYSLINKNHSHHQQLLTKHQQDFQDYNHYHQQQHQNAHQMVNPSLTLNLKNYTPTSSVLPSPNGAQFNLPVSSNGLNVCNNNTSIGIPNNMNNQSQIEPFQSQLDQQTQSLHLTLPRSEPQRIYYGLDSFDDLKTIRRNSITSLFEDPSTPNFYGDEDSAYDSTSNESLRLTAKELTKRPNSKKYFTLPTKLGRRLRKSSCPEFNGTNSLTPSPVSDCPPTSKLIFNGPTFPPSKLSSASSSISSSSSVSPPSTLSSLSSSPSSSSSSSPSSNVSNVSVSVSSSSSMVTEMSAPHLHNHHVDNCNSNQISHATVTSTTSTGANENVCHCCYLLGCHSNQGSTNTVHYQNNHQQQQQPKHGRVNPGSVNTNVISSTGQQSTLETLWEEPSSGHESVRLTEEAIYAAMRELNISLPSKDSVNGQPVVNRNTSWLRANFLKAFRRSSSSSSKNRSSKLIQSSSLTASNNVSLNYDEREKNEPKNGSGNQQENEASEQHQQQYPDVIDSGASEVSSKRISSGPSSASSLSSLPLSCSSIPPTPPLTPLPSYHLQQQLTVNPNQLSQQTVYLSEQDVIKELNRQLAEKDQLLQEVCMESINHLNTIENLKELVTQLRGEIDLLKKQNDQLNAKYSINCNQMDKIKSAH